MRPIDAPGANIVPPAQLTACEQETFSGGNKNAWTAPPGYVGRVTAKAEHIDEFNHVNNLVYPQWALEAAWHHSTLLGFPFSKIKEGGIGFVIARHEFEYKGAVLEGDEVLVATWISDNDKRLRMTRDYEMRLASTGKTVFRGQTFFIIIDMASGKPCRMPQRFIDAYEPLAQ